MKAKLVRAVRDALPAPDGALRLATTHQRLAERSGVSRPKLSLQLKVLERAGVLRLRRGLVEIVDPDRICGLSIDPLFPHSQN